MSDDTNDGGSKEAVALQLLQLIYRKDNNVPSTKEGALDLYSECLQAVRGARRPKA
jgi:hypothetical protein